MAGKLKVQRLKLKGRTKFKDQGGEWKPQMNTDGTDGDCELRMEELFSASRRKLHASRVCSPEGLATVILVTAIFLW
jgi:hypothetical protein